MLPKITRLQPSGRTKDQQEVLSYPTAYIYEQKFDGFGCLARVDAPSVDLKSKRGLSLSGFHEVRKELLGLGFDRAIFDGELVCPGKDSAQGFQRLLQRKGPVVYNIYDLLYLQDYDLRALPLVERKIHLRRVLRGRHKHLRFVRFYDAADAQELAHMAQTRDWEGLVAKLRDQVYDPLVAANWVKLKRQDYALAKRRWPLFTRKSG